MKNVIHHATSVSDLQTSWFNSADRSRSDDGNILLLCHVVQLARHIFRNTFTVTIHFIVKTPNDNSTISLPSIDSLADSNLIFKTQNEFGWNSKNGRHISRIC